MTFLFIETSGLSSLSERLLKMKKLIIWGYGRRNVEIGWLVEGLVNIYVDKQKEIIVWEGKKIDIM